MINVYNEHIYPVYSVRLSELTTRIHYEPLTFKPLLKEHTMSGSVFMEDSQIDLLHYCDFTYDIRSDIMVISNEIRRKNFIASGFFFKDANQLVLYWYGNKEVPVNHVLMNYIVGEMENDPVAWAKEGF